MKEIRWAVLGTGVIANEMAVALKKNGRNISAVGNRTHSKAVAFAEKYGIQKVYDDFNDMFTDPDIDVIYITTPHNTHIDFMRKAIENGKHVLVEKSITLNSGELEEAIAYLREHDEELEKDISEVSHEVAEELTRALVCVEAALDELSALCESFFGCKPVARGAVHKESNEMTF